MSGLCHELPLLTPRTPTPAADKWHRGIAAAYKGIYSLNCFTCPVAGEYPAAMQHGGRSGSRGCGASLSFLLALFSLQRLLWK